MEQVGTLDTLVLLLRSAAIFSPSFLINCNQLLAPNGILVLSCPNYFGFDIMTLGTASDSLDAEHINMFNPSSLRLLVESLNYEVLEITTPGELDADIVRSKILEKTLSIQDQPFLKKVLVDDWDDLGPSFQKYLKDHNLSSHMCLVARKLEQ